ncbi:MAG: hypothetical protein K9M49_08360 [Candidatus Marinimicrobia bacterium]|nr:hypothetical protein [Candidatus Neomarinimicrobiota bacterium]
MDSVSLLLLIVFIILLGVTIRYFFFSSKKKTSAHDMEIRALNHILAGEKEAALRLLKEIGRKDTSNLGVFLQVGDLNRQLGNAEAAVRVHQDVLDRHSISPEIRLMAHERLAKDYEALEQYEAAAQHAREILQENKKNLWALESLHRYAVKSKKWSTAIKAFQKETAAGGSPNPLLPSIYKTQEALESNAKGKKSEALSMLKQAIKLNNKCAAPYFHLGKINQDDGNFKHAIDYYTTFAELDPSSSSLVFSDIEKMYFELGQFEKVEQFYQRLQRKQPDNLEVAIGLANYYERKGEFRDALALMEEVKEPDNIHLSYTLGHLQLLEKTGHKDAHKAKVEALIDEDRRLRILTCGQCGFTSSDPKYICEKCGWVQVP